MSRIDWDEDASEERITLPPIRDMFREELSRSPKPRHRRLSPFSLAPLKSALNEDDATPMSVDSSRSSSPAFGKSYKQTFIPTTQTPSTGDSNAYYSHTASMVSASTPASSRSSCSVTTPSPKLSPLPPLTNENMLLRRYTVASTGSQPSSHAEHPRSKSYSFSGILDAQARKHAVGYYTSSSSTSTLVPALDWNSHARRGSSNSTQSSQSSAYDASTHRHPSSPSNALQFQPLPHTHFRPPFVPTSVSYESRQTSTPSPPVDYQSPFGVLIADASQGGVPPADPQRLAILRGLRPSSSHSSLSSGTEELSVEPRKSVSAAKYECPYCSKRFNRPSSLKIHINTHTGEKPFQCPHPGCGRCFSVQSNMRRHARIHTQSPRKQQESSGEELADDGPQPMTPPSTSPQIRTILPPSDTFSEAMSSFSNESSTPEPTPHRSQAPLPSPRRTRSSQTVSSGRFFSHHQHSRSMSDEELMRTSSSLRDFDSGSRSPTPGDESRPEKRSRRSPRD